MRLQNILFRKGTALFQFNEGTVLQALTTFTETASLMGDQRKHDSPKLPSLSLILGTQKSITKSGIPVHKDKFFKIRRFDLSETFLALFPGPRS